MSKKKIEVKDKEHNIYFQMNAAYFDEVLSIVEAKHSYGQYLKLHRKDLYEFIMKCTAFLDNQKHEVRIGSRIHCIVNNIIEVPICMTCNINPVDMQDVRIWDPTPCFCSRSCCTKHPATQKKMRSTMKDKYGVEHALQDKELCRRATQHKHETNLRKYGVEEVFSAKCVQEKKEKTNISRHGVKCTLQAKCVKEKTRQTCLKQYGVSHHMKNKDIYAKSRQTCKELYGDEHPIRTQRIKDKLNTTNRDRYGVDWTFQSCNNKEKTKKRCQEKYDTDYALQAPEVKRHIKDTLQKNYGVTHNSQIPEVRSRMQKKYAYDNVQFDSSAELCFYIWLKDVGIEFEHQPAIRLEYELNGVKHMYCPDFKVGDMLFEIKGDHFFKDCDPSQQMVCPYDHSQDALYEAKHQCMLQNNVIVMTSSEYVIFQSYVEDMYGKQYWKQFKRQ